LFSKRHVCLWYCFEIKQNALRLTRVAHGAGEQSPGQANGDNAIFHDASCLARLQEHISSSVRRSRKIVRHVNRISLLAGIGMEIGSYPRTALCPGVNCGTIGVQSSEFTFRRARAALHPPFFAASIDCRSGESVGVGNVCALVFGGGRRGAVRSFWGVRSAANRRCVDRQCLCWSAGTFMPRARAMDAQRGE
jgi:hypothetical protein